MNWKFYKEEIFDYEKTYDDLGGPWSGHKYFAYDLVRNFKPKKIVELGTHLGCSLFSFAQGVKDGKLSTELDGIDTWRGDKHAGLYGELIFSRIKEIKNICYPKTKINFIRKTFDEASNDYKNNSIDILHIDGLHSYKAVKHDFETWVQKVRSDGIVIFHDTVVKKGGFGVYKLWNELKKDYKTIEFNHAFGLGALFKSSKTFKQIKTQEQFFDLYYSTVAEKEELRWKLEKDEELIENYKTRINNYESKINKVKSNPLLLLFWKMYKRFKNIK